MAEFKFVYRSTMSEWYNKRQYTKMIELIKSSSQSSDFKSIDVKIEKVFEQIKFILSRRGKYIISLYKNFDQVEYFSLEIRYVQKNYNPKILTVEFMPKVTPPAISEYPDYEFWMDVSHFIDHKFAYIKHKKMCSSPFKEIYNFNDNYNIKIPRHVFWNSGFHLNNDGELIICLNFRYQMHGITQAFSYEPFKMHDFISLLLYDPMVFVYQCYFKNSEVDFESFKFNEVESFKILEMMHI